MKAKIQNTVTREINVDVPSWWKKKDGATQNYYAIISEEKHNMVATPLEGYGITVFTYNFSSSGLNFADLIPCTEEEYEKAKAQFIETISK